MALGPIQVSWEITAKCNLKCVYCYTNSPRALKELKREECFKLLEELKDFGVLRIVFTGGEPFLREDFLEILRYASLLGFFSNVITNGSLLSESVVKQLSKIERLGLMVTLHSSKPELEEMIRRGIHYKMVLSGIKLLAKYNVNFCVGTPVTKLNYRDVKNLITSCEKLKIPKIRFLRFVPVGRGNVNLSISTIELDKILDEIKLRRSNLEIELDDFEEGYCPAAKMECAITADGYVLPCPFFRNIVAGNIRVSKFSDIWQNSKNMKLFRNINPKKLKGFCKTCNNNRICKGGCRVFAYIYYGDFYAENPVCSHNSNYKKGIVNVE
jgi:radical SAM protein with 4Fe4S-binding SPASM domain